MTPDGESCWRSYVHGAIPDLKLGDLNPLTPTLRGFFPALWRRHCHRWSSVFMPLIKTACWLIIIWFQMSTALSEIVVGTVAQLVIGAALAARGLLGSTEWITFLAGTGAIVLTFLAGAELDPAIFRNKWR